MAQIFHYPDGLWPNVFALGFTLFGFGTGVALLGSPSWTLNALGFFLVAQTLVWSAYFIHEFAHKAIFMTANANERWGTLMSWINGSCYASFADMRRKHMRHHVERADVITSDARKRSARGRILGIAAIRLSAFALLGWWSLKALLLYFLAYLVFVTVLRFADCFQHTYDAYPILNDQPIPADKVRDRAYEQANTYTNVVGLDKPWLNLLWLNFGYHNAHHERPAAPWHRLPAFHRELYPADYAQVTPVRELLRSFHVNRVKRVLASDYGQVLPPGTPGRADGFLGAVGVSFLT